MSRDAYRFIVSVILILSALTLCIIGKISGETFIGFMIGAAGVDAGAAARVIRRPEKPPR